MEILAPKLLILASAGSGKTYQLSNRIIGLVARGDDPQRIVALTFTRKAASEFADSMLNKLARAATDEAQAGQLRDELKLPDADFQEVLARVCRSLHRITLGTMDSFFARVVRGFQYELGLTGGRFELIEGTQQEMASSQILDAILGDVLAGPGGEQFSHAFRRASIGREQQSISRKLREFVDQWHRQFRQHPGMTWGPQELCRALPEDWEKQKFGMAAELVAMVERDDSLKDGHRKALLNCIEIMLSHTIGSGVMAKDMSLLKLILASSAEGQSGVMELKYRSDFALEAGAAEAFRAMVRLAADCEMAAAVQRTRAIHDVVEAYDQHCARMLRSRGRLGFDDVKLLMSQWVRSEEGRLRREAVDFRLDSRTDHWLLDEFQDTSRIEWDGLLPLIDEVASDGEQRSLFIVGDRKQAIYAWRGGEVGLFDQVMARYGSGLAIDQLAESWRSCPEVLSLVNRVCDNPQGTRELFGGVAAQWDCPQHVSAKPLRQQAKRGHSRVEIVDGWEAKYDRMTAILEALGVGRREMTCGILLRSNKKAAEVANELRGRGFDVVLEGQREPGVDSPLGVGITQLLRWLADPANSLARGVIEMSPLGDSLRQSHGEDWDAIWSALSSDIARDGYQATIRGVIDRCPLEWSAFGHRRIRDLLLALAELDHQGGISARQAATTLEQLKISQSPGIAAIQVMTIHKSKGLGFDVVILPEIPTKKIPEPQKFTMTRGPGWISQTPPQWVRDLNPALHPQEEAWTAQQQHEALCTLYVALTRAKRGLYVLMDPPAKSHEFDKPSLANWIFHGTGGEPTDDEVIHEQGCIDWVAELPLLEEEAAPPPPLPLPVTCRSDSTACLSRVAPSRSRSPSRSGTHRRQSASGMQFGREVHGLLESISWIDDGMPELPAGDAADAVRRLLQDADTRKVFVRGERNIQLLREQATDAILDGRWISGVIDRLHLHRNPDGVVVAAEIIDFKTDAVDDAGQLVAAHHQQLDGYRQCIRKLHPEATISCSLLSTHLGLRIDV